MIILQSGEPITILDGNGGSTYQLASPVSTANFAPGYGCNNALNSGSLATKLANWVNPSAYRPAPVVGPDGSTGFGNSPRNCIIGPGQSNIDFTLAKTFKLGENQNVLFRTEFFNLFNHPSFMNPTSTANVAAGSAIGEINQTVGTPRLIQFSLKYLFNRRRSALCESRAATQLHFRMARLSTALPCGSTNRLFAARISFTLAQQRVCLQSS